MISTISGEISPSASVRETGPLDSPAFGALIAALFAQLGVATPPAEPSAPDALPAPEQADAREPSEDLIESAAAVARVFAAPAIAALPLTPAQATASAASTPAAAAALPALPALPEAAAPAQLAPALPPAPRAGRNNSEAARGRERAPASEAAGAPPELAKSAPLLRTPSESAAAHAQLAPAQPAVQADARAHGSLPARPRDANSELQPDARVSYGDSLAHRPEPRALYPKPTPEFGLEPVPRDASIASPAALRIEGSAAPAGFAADRPAVQQAAAPNTGPILERIAWLAEQGGGSARLHLDPPALGELEIVVRVRGRRVDVHLRAEEAGAQQAVLESRERLVEALAVKDFRVDEFSVGGGRGERSESGSGESLRERMAPPPEHSRAQAPTPAPNTARVAALRPAPAGSIDLRV